MSDRLTKKKITRRTVLSTLGTATGVALAGILPSRSKASMSQSEEPMMPMSHGKHSMEVVGECTSGTLDPELYLTEFDWGRKSILPSGQTLREYDIVAVDKEIEIAPGVFFPAWTYNGRVPGPTIRANEGDKIRVNFVNDGTHPHTIHFHGFHPPAMDGSMPNQYVNPGGTFVYEFDAFPFGLHLYHCHSVPLKRHIHKGLYGTFIIDPPGGRAPAKELVMAMNGFDTNFDGDNEIYAVNSVAHHHMRHPIPVKVGELVRLYVVNFTEFDLINSFHIHANFFHEFRTGTKLEPDFFTDTTMMCQGERSILEMTFDHAGMYMFHAHQSEFAELGWMGMFDAREDL